MKICKKCGVERPEDSFSIKENRLESRCKQCKAAATAEWRARYPEKRKESDARQYALRPEKKKARTAKWRKENKEKRNAGERSRYEADPEPKLRQNAAWYAANPGKAREYESQRRAAKLRAQPGWADPAKIEEFYFAADFLGMVTGEWYHVDHVVPLQSLIVCGLHTEQNLQVLPASDNLRKSNRRWPDMP